MVILRVICLLGVVLLAPVASANGQHKNPFHFKITITNLTFGQSFTSELIATHKSYVTLFELGSMASENKAWNYLSAPVSRG